jgi:hypothetical protein
MPTFTEMQERLSAGSRWDFSDLSAVYINCTLKRSPESSHTQGLADRSVAIMGAERRVRGGRPKQQREEAAWSSTAGRLLDASGLPVERELSQKHRIRVDDAGDRH